MTQRNEAFHAKVATRLSAAITHDIKAPLNYVVKALQGMCEANMRPEVLKEELKQVFQASEQIYLYSDNLTKLAKIVFANAEIPFSPTPVRSLIQERIDIFEPIAASNGTLIRNQVPADMVFSSHADILSIAIHNLLDNAIKFTKEGKIYLEAGKDDQQTAYIKIVDTGVGIGTDILERYNAVVNDTDYENLQDDGMGLGLPLVKDIIQLIGGRMTIESTVGKGTTVTLAFARHCTS